MLVKRMCLVWRPHCSRKADGFRTFLARPLLARVLSTRISTSSGYWMWALLLGPGFCLGGASCVPAHTHAQVKDRPARSPNAAEIRQLIMDIWESIKAAGDGVFAENCKTGKEQLIWSLDNARVHHKAVADWDDPNGWRVKAGIPGTVIFPPPYSPDLHQVIEHAHANTMLVFRDWEVRYPDKCAALLKDITGFGTQLRHDFFEGNKQPSVYNNVRRLTTVYHLVIHAGGDYIDAAWR